MVALREQFGVADLNRPSVNILRDLLIIMRCRAEHFLDLRLMRYVGDFPGAHRLPSIIVCRMHNFGTPAPSGKVQKPPGRPVSVRSARREWRSPPELPRALGKRRQSSRKETAAPKDRRR